MVRNCSISAHIFKRHLIVIVSLSIPKNTVGLWEFTQNNLETMFKMNERASLQMRKQSLPNFWTTKHDILSSQSWDNTLSHVFMGFFLQKYPKVERGILDISYDLTCYYGGMVYFKDLKSSQMSQIRNQDSKSKHNFSYPTPIWI